MTPARLLLPLLLATPLLAQDAAPVTSPLGPLVGHVAPDRALLWVRAAPGARQATVRVGGGEARSVPLQARGRGFAVLEVDGLAPERAQEVAVEVPGGPSGAVRFRTPSPPRAWGKVRFGVGSCAGFSEQPVWDQIPATDPDFFLWLGDNCYYRSRRGGGADWDSVEHMLERQLENRLRPGVLALMRGTACYAVWDDHDYGPNNSDGRFPLKAESRAVHRMLWANPGWGEDEEGVYFSFRRGPVELFCLDDRWWKDVRDQLPRPERRLYGEKQLAWLRRGLAASDAPVKVIAGGVQQLLGYPLAEGWSEAREERAAFLAWLGQQPGCERVIFLSGDIHVSELYRVQVAPGRFAWELTSSGLAQQNPAPEAFALAKRPERQWVATTPGMFCVVEVDLPEGRPPEEGQLLFRCLDAQGAVQAETRAGFDSFGAAGAPAPAGQDPKRF